MRKVGDDAIECSGICAGWIHRRCAGLNKKAYLSLSESTEPFFCPYCRLNKQELELESLRNLVGNLSAHLSLVTDELSFLKKAMLKSNDDACPSLASAASNVGLDLSLPCTQQKTFAQAAQSAQSSNSERSKDTPQQSERDQNVILFGVEEYAAGTARLDRFNRDMDRATSVLSKLVYKSY